MDRPPRPRRVLLNTLPNLSYPPASSNQVLLAADIRPEAVRALLRLHPVFVTKDDTGNWSVVAGLRTYRLARAVLETNECERIPVIEVDAATAAFLGLADQYLTPVLADDLPADRRAQWAKLSTSNGHRLLRAARFAEAAFSFQAPPARTEGRPSTGEQG